jgi:hypothetical protein
MNDIFKEHSENCLIFDWPAFLQMLSADGIESFIEELGIDAIGHFHDVQKLARACLEVEIFCHLSLDKDPSTKESSLAKAWLDYRQAISILRDDELLEMRSHVERFDNILQVAFLYLYRRWINQETALALWRWFIDFFPETPDKVWDWWHTLRTRTLKLKNAFTNTEINSVNKINQIIYAVEQEESLLLCRFEKVSQDMETKQATLWNTLLGTSLFDTAGYYSWIFRVKECLHRKLMLNAWQNIVHTLSEKDKKGLIMVTKRYAKNRDGLTLSPPYLRYH